MLSFFWMRVCFVHKCLQIHFIKEKREICKFHACRSLFLYISFIGSIPWYFDQLWFRQAWHYIEFFFVFFFFLQIAVFIIRQMASGCNHLSFAFYLSQILFAWSVFNKCCIVQHAQYFQTYSNNSECIQIYSNNSEYIQIMPNIFK